MKSIILKHFEEDEVMDLDDAITKFLKDLPPKKRFLVRSGLNNEKITKKCDEKIDEKTQPEVIEIIDDEPAFKLHQTGKNCFEVCIEKPSANVTKVSEKLPAKSSKIWRPFDVEESPDESVMIIENPEEVIDLTEAEENEKLFIEVHEEIPKIHFKSEPIECTNFIQNYPDFEPQKRKRDEDFEITPKRQKFNESHKRLNEKFLKLILNRARSQNQEKVICRYYECLRCNVKIYLKKVLEHHVKDHKNFNENKEVKIGYAVIKLKK